MDLQLINVVRGGDVDGLKQLQERNPSILHQATPVGNTLLHLAAKFENLDFLVQVCELCPSLITKINRCGDTALHVGARTKHFPVVNHLIDRMASCCTFDLLRWQNQKGDSALHEALRYCRHDVAMLLIQKDPSLCHLVNDARESPLFLAVTKGYDDVVFHVLNSHPSSSCHDGPQDWKAAQVLKASPSPACDGPEGWRAQVLSSSLSPTCDGPKGWTALHASAVGEKQEEGQISYNMTEKLLQVTPKLGRVVDIYGRTPLHYAVDTYNAAMVGLFLRYDASLAYIGDKDGWTPLHVAVHRSLDHPKEFSIIENIIQYCPDLEYLLDNRGNNVLHTLMDRMGNQGGRFFHDWPVWKFAAMEELLNQPNNDGNTLLHLAVLSKRFISMKTLIRATSIDKKARNNNYLTASDIAPYQSGKSSKREDKITSIKTMKAINSPNDQPLLSSGSCLWIETLDDSDFGKEVIREQAVHEDPEQNFFKKLSKTHMVVATLIATVAFAAALQIPGGYEQSSGKEGMAVLAGQVAFGAFVISDVLALSSSVLTLLLYFMGEVVDPLKPGKFFILETSLILIAIAIVAMIVAFMCGVFAVLVKTHSLWIGILTILVCLSVPFLACFLTWKTVDDS